MVTPSELLRVLLAPIFVSALLAGIGRWRRWAWAMPIAVGAGFVAGYALIGVPKLPPVDGTDWLFWLTAPVTACAALDATALCGKRALSHILAPLVVGIVVYVIMRP